jgi:hypothetical protein
MDERSDDEEDVWRAIIAALRSNGATPAEAIDGASLLLGVYRRQRDGLLSKPNTDEPPEGSMS